VQASKTGFDKSVECSKTVFSQKITFLFSSKNITLTKKHNFEENFQSILKIKAFTFEKQTFEKPVFSTGFDKSVFSTGFSKVCTMKKTNDFTTNYVCTIIK
jgi:hypothetical protein